MNATKVATLGIPFRFRLLLGLLVVAFWLYARRARFHEST